MGEAGLIVPDRSTKIERFHSQMDLKGDDKDTVESFKMQNLSKSYAILFALLLAFSSNQWSRQSLYYLCDFSSSADPFKHINAGLGFTKEMYAALASFAFTAVFAFFSLFTGGLADKFNRNNIVAFSCAIWSVTTALQSFATSFAGLVPLRAIIGASQSFLNPAAYTLIADIFPKEMIGRANGIFSGT